MSWLNYLIYEPQQLANETHLWQPEENASSWGANKFPFC